MMAKQGKVLAECLFLFILACIAWAIGIESRIYLRNLDQEDFIDFCMVNVLVFSGFWLYKSCLLYSKKRKKNIDRILLTGGFIFILWEFLLFYLYATFYYEVPLSETDFYDIVIPLVIFVSIGFGIYFKQAYVLAKVLEVKEDLPNHPQNEIHEFYHDSLTVSNNLNQIIVSKGNNTVVLNEADVLMVYTRDKVVWLFTDSNEKFISSYALKELEEKLDSRNFFRINRQAILSRKVVKGYQPVENQKLLVQLDVNSLEEDERIISKYTAPAFKKWLIN